MVFGVVILRAGDGWVGGPVMLEVEGGVVELLRGMLLLLVAVVTRAKLLGFDVCPLLGLALLAGQSWQTMLLLLLGLLRLRLGLLGHPRVPGSRRTAGGAADAVAARVGHLRGGHSGVAVGRQVLVKLVDVEGLDVGDDLAAELSDVHVAEIDVGWLAAALLQGAAFTLEIWLAGLHVCFRGGRRSWWTLRLS